MLRALLLIPFVVLALTCCGSAGLPDPIEIDSGRISGIVEGSNQQVKAYLGIPYAAPPVNGFRWKPPQPVEPWDGVFQADKPGVGCAQTEGIPFFAKSVATAPFREDCLYLDVRTPAQSQEERLPVMVWIHGGAFAWGSAHAYKGPLVEKGVVLVVVQYRLGPFGFMAHPALSAESEHGASGNYGLLDQIEALKWVQRNVAAFGGDPNNVTIFGQSSGSWSVNLLTASPLAKGLFHRAIGQSGAAFLHLRTRLYDLTEPTGAVPSAESVGERFATELGLEGVEADVLSALRAKPAKEILDTMTAGGLPRQTRFMPAVDRWVIPGDVRTVYSERNQTKVPLLVGFTADEGRSLVRDEALPADLTAFKQQSDSEFGDLSDRFLGVYGVNDTTTAIEAAFNITRDILFSCETRIWVREAAAAGQPVYPYYFSRSPPGSKSERYGAYHGVEMPYVFNNLVPLSDYEEYTETDRLLADQISSYWINFAKTGNPNGGGLPEWPLYDADTGKAIDFGDQIGTSRPPFHEEACELFDEHWSQVNGHASH